jgi:hypothetical protein
VAIAVHARFRSAAFFLAPPGQQMGHAPAPRYLCPRLQVFQALVALFFTVFLLVDMD